MAGGGLLQLVAYGSQDVYLTSNASVTFFKAVHRRHTAFSIESIIQTLNGTVGWTQRVTATISRNGDLLYGTCLEIKLPEIGEDHSWVKGVGFRMIESCELDIGGQRIDKIDGRYMDMMQELSVKEDKQYGLDKMVGRDWTGLDAFGLPDKKCGSPRKMGKLYVPINFFYSMSPSLALPLISLQYHEVKLTFTFASYHDVLRTWRPATDHAGSGTGVPAGWRSYTGPAPDAFSADLYVDYVFLDTDERRKFATVSHEILITQVQNTGREQLTVNSKDTFQKVRLNLNHPVKAIIWATPHADSDSHVITTPDSKIDDIKFTSPSISLDAFNYDEYAGFNRVKGHAYPGADATRSNYEYDMGNVELKGWDSIADSVPMNNPIAQAKLTLNGHDRFSERDGTYFQLVQPYMHWPRVPKKPVMTYSFAISPSDLSPSGTANFSRIDTAHLMLKFHATHRDPHIMGGATSVQRNLDLYAINFNVLRLLSGMGGLAFSN